MSVSKRDIIVIILFIALIGFQFFDQLAISLKNSILSQNFGGIRQTRQIPNLFENMEIEAKSAIVWDAKDNRVLFAKNEHVQLPLASLTKIMTAYVALKAGGEVATVSKQAVEEEGDSGLLVGEKWNLPDLAKLTLVSSANDGARSLAASWVGSGKPEGEATSFTEAMNAEAKSLGLFQTYFLNETGLDISEKTAGAYGSAEDIAKLFYKTVVDYPAIFEATSRGELTAYSLEHKKHLVKNTNDNVEKITGIVASKTGFTPLAGGNLVIIIDVGINHPIVVSVLGSSSSGRFIDARKLIEGAVAIISNE